jgi:hypothetical protein
MPEDMSRFLAEHGVRFSRIEGTDHARDRARGRAGQRVMRRRCPGSSSR